MMKLRFTEAKTFNIMQTFALLHTLALDFCSSLTRMEKDFFAYMPNLMCLSLCGTRVADLWATTAALSRLTCLVELRFQNRKYCKDTGPCPALLEGITDLHGISLLDPTSDSGLVSSKMTNLLIEVSPSILHVEEESKSPTSILDSDLSHSSFAADVYCVQHPSPICFEKHYREYMITMLPQLKVLDNIPVTELDRKMAKSVFSMHFEHLPYKRQYSESITSVLHMRETGIMYNRKFSGAKHSTSSKKSQIYHSRSLCAAKYGSSICPVRLHLSRSSHTMKEGSKTLRSRQFEYHPSDSSLMAVGTLDGEVVVINHEMGNIFRYFPSFSATNRAIALCWLHKYPSKLLTGFDSGSLVLYDINQVPPAVEDIDLASSTMTYNKFEQLTSVHVNATNDKFLASSYSRKVSIYDICSGQRLQLLDDIHQEPINVAKFAWHSPHLLVTSSFDRDVKMWDLRQKPIQPCYTTSSSRGNVMVCFSPDDLFLLVSAVDNEVKQLLAVDGRLHTEFDIVSTGSLQNYTRSYYMNGRDYIISGSSEESVVRIYCSQTGRRLRNIYLENWDQGSSYLVQSLRSDPFRHFDMAILAASVRTSSPWEILKVNMLASSNCQKTIQCQEFHSPWRG